MTPTENKIKFTGLKTKFSKEHPGIQLTQTSPSLILKPGSNLNKTSQPLPTLQRGKQNSPTVLRLGDGVGAALAVVLGHIFTLLEGGSLVLQNVSDTEGVAVKSPLLAQFGAIRAQGLIVNLREVYVFAFIHHVTLFLVNIS